MSTHQCINGILLLDKPLDVSSNGILQRVKRLFQAKKAGHTGSLDPKATGMLPICFGEATKFSQHLLDANKTYQVTAKLGVTTTTGDSEGDVLQVLPLVNVNLSRVQTVLQSFMGLIYQVPPMFSALKHQGRPLYELARQGIEIERKAREVNIFQIHLQSFHDDEIRFEVTCSKGTYVRTLVENIGEKLGCGAHVAMLHRTTVYPYEQSTMYTVDKLEKIAKEEGQSALLSCLLPMETAIKHLPAVHLSASNAYAMRNGQRVHLPSAKASSLVRFLTEDECFLGIGEVQSDGTAKSHRLIAQ